MTRYVVGVTGGIASGKTNITDALKAIGAHVIDADDINVTRCSHDDVAL